MKRMNVGKSAQQQGGLGRCRTVRTQKKIVRLSRAMRISSGQGENQRLDGKFWTGGKVLKFQWSSIIDKQNFGGPCGTRLLWVSGVNN